MANLAVFALSSLAWASCAHAARLYDGQEAGHEGSPLVGTWGFTDPVSARQAQYTITDGGGERLQFRQPMTGGAAVTGHLEPLASDGWFQADIVDSKTLAGMGTLQFYYDAGNDLLQSRSLGSNYYAVATRVAAERVELECPAATRQSRPDSRGFCECLPHHVCVDEGVESGGSCALAGVERFPASCAGCQCEERPWFERGGTWITVHRADVVTVSRQGKVIASARGLNGSVFNHMFGVTDLHRRFVVSAVSEPGKPVDGLFFAYEDELCGVGLFTAPSLQCSKLSPTDRRAIASSVARYMDGAFPRAGAAPRGFGVEFELVSRAVPADLKRATRSSTGALEACFGNRTKDPAAVGQACPSAVDCPLTQFCVPCSECDAAVGTSARCTGCPSRSEGQVCQLRSECQEGAFAGGDGRCPMPFSGWTWMDDPTVEPLDENEVALLASRGEGSDEGHGTGFELVSPGPPGVLAGPRGARSLLEVLGVLRSMGVQAGTSSGLHVHVNVGDARAPGAPLTHRGIAHVWAAFAKYQLVIDEMLPPSRVDNRFAKPLFLGAGARYKAVRGLFLGMHGYLARTQGEAGGTLMDFCNAALGGGQPCSDRYPRKRYYALNLAPLGRLGTVEFRNHGSTHDPERALHWTLFAVAFVEHFGGEGGTSEVGPFFEGTAKEGLGGLARAQQAAAREDLLDALRPRLAGRSLDYLAGREWERSTTGCSN